MRWSIDRCRVGMGGRRNSSLGRWGKASVGRRTCAFVDKCGTFFPLRMVRSSSAGSEKRSVCSLLLLLLLGMHLKNLPVFFASNKNLD